MHPNSIINGISKSDKLSVESFRHLQQAETSYQELHTQLSHLEKLTWLLLSEREDNQAQITLEAFEGLDSSNLLVQMVNNGDGTILASATTRDGTKDHTETQ